jgi:hypothetical protein
MLVVALNGSPLPYPSAGDRRVTRHSSSIAAYSRRAIHHARSAHNRGRVAALVRANAIISLSIPTQQQEIHA